MALPASLLNSFLKCCPSKSLARLVPSWCLLLGGPEQTRGRKPIEWQRNEELHEGNQDDTLSRKLVLVLGGARQMA